jgi:hypothetical protein
MPYILASFRLAVAFAIGVAITWQISDRVANNVFRPAEYFSFFTIQTSILTALVLAISAWFMFKKGFDSLLIVRLRISATSAIIVVGIVYNLLLRDVPPAAADLGYVWPVIPNEILHVWAPILVAVDWLLTKSQTSVRIHSALWVTVFPITWVIFCIIRGNIDGWWPYWFLDPTDPGGIPQMLTYISAIAAFFIGIGYGLVGLHRITNRLGR